MDEQEKKLTVGQLKKFLDKFPDDAIAWGYEGEISGIVVGSPAEGLGIKELGYVTNCGEEVDEK